jgi:hypothetical protein
MRALMNFQEGDGWTVHIIGADARTVLMSFSRVRDKEMLLRIVAKLHFGRVPLCAYSSNSSVLMRLSDALRESRIWPYLRCTKREISQP